MTASTISAHRPGTASRYVGRIGALAVALGVGIAIATTGHGFAYAEDGSTDASASASPDDRTADTDRPGVTTSPSRTSQNAGDDTGRPAGDDSPTGAAGSEIRIGVQSEPNAAGTDDAGASDDAAPSDDTAGDLSGDADAGTAGTEPPPLEEPVGDNAAADPPVPAASRQTSGRTGAVPLADASDPSRAELPGGSAPTSPSPAGIFGQARTTASPVAGNAAFGVTATAAAPGTPAPAPVRPQPTNPIEATIGGVIAVANIAATAVNTLLSGLLSPGPTTPAPPVLLFAVLGYVQRQLQRTFLNETPTAVADTVTTAEDVAVLIPVLANDTDADLDAGDILTVVDFTQPTNGTLALNPDGTFTYTPDADFNGTDTFTYTVSDEASPFNIKGFTGFLFGGGHTSSTTVAITVTAVDDAPEVDDVVDATDEDTAILDGNVLTNATGTGTVAIANPGTFVGRFGTLTLAADGSYTYTPQPLIADQFVLTPAEEDLTRGNFDTQLVNDGSKQYAAFAFTPTVSGIYEIRGLTSQDTVLAIHDGAFDPAAELTNLVAYNDDDPVRGGVAPRLVVNLAAGRTYTLVTSPFDNFVTLAEPVSYEVSRLNPTAAAQTLDNGEQGTDTFTYQAADDSGTTTGTLTITVNGRNDTPIAIDRVIIVAENGTATGNLLDNAIDPEDNPLTVTPVVFQGVSIDADGNYAFTPIGDLTPGQSDDRRFGVRVSDGAASTVSSVAFVAVGGGPAVADTTAATDEDTAILDGNVLTDATGTGTVVIANPGTFVGQFGTLTLAADGSYTYTPQSLIADQFVLTPAEEDLTRGTFKTQLIGPSGIRPFAAFTFTPTVSGIYEVRGLTSQDTVLAIYDGAFDPAAELTNLVAYNDDDPNSVTSIPVLVVELIAGRTYTLVTSPFNNSVTLPNPISYQVTRLDPTAAAQTLGNGEQGTDTFTYQAADDSGTTTGTLTITVNGRNDTPIVIDRVIVVTENGTATGNLLDNAIDPEGDLLTVTPLFEQFDPRLDLSIDADGNFAYTPDADLQPGDLTDFAILLRVFDATESTVSLVNVVVVGGGPAVPDATADTDEDTAILDGNVLTDATGTGTVSIANPGTFVGQYGTLVLAADGSYTYTPQPLVADQFTLTPAEQDLTRGTYISNYAPTFAPGVRPYSAYLFTPGDSGIYVFRQVTDSNTTLTIYDGTFDPQAPARNVIGFDDDEIFGTVASPQLILPLTAGRTYVLVSSTFDARPTAQEAQTSLAPVLTPLVYQVQRLDPLAPAQRLRAIDQVTDTFIFEAADDTGRSPGTLLVTVNGRNDAPIAVNDLVFGFDDRTLTVNALANDIDPEGDRLTIRNVRALDSARSGRPGAPMPEGFVGFIPNGSVEPGATVTFANLQYFVTDGANTSEAVVIYYLTGR